MAGGDRAEAEDRARLAILTRNRNRTTDKIQGLIAKRDTLERERGQIGRHGNGTAAQRRAAIRAKSAAIRRISVDIAALKELRRGIDDEIAELGYNPPASADESGGMGDEGPTAGDVLDAAAAEAALTPGLADDLAAAKAIEDQANADLAAARASGDPRRIADAARAALSAKQSREQIEALMANTDALAANTDALRGFGGSTVLSYRGQDFVLGSLAPPSSDRLVGAETGI